MQAPKSSGGTTFEKHPAKQTNLVCTKIIDKGTVFNPAKQEEKRKIMFVFESTEVMAEGDYAGKPFLVFANFNFSMYQNSLMCKFIEGWQGKRFADQNEADMFDISSLLGKPLFANIVHNGDFVNIDSPMPAIEAMSIPKPVGDTVIFSFEEPKLAEWDKLSDKMKESMKKVPEYQAWVNSPIPSPESAPAVKEAQQAADLDFDDDVPF